MAGTAGQAEWIPILDREPAEVAWSRRGANRFELNVQHQQPRLTMQHAVDRGLLSFGDLPASSFIVRFVLTIEEWEGTGGFFWGLQPDPDAFPEARHGCRAVTLRKSKSELLVTVEEFELQASALDNTQLFCTGSFEFARGTRKIPRDDAVAVEMTVENGRVTAIQIDRQPLPLRWSSPSPAFSRNVPASYGFFAFDSEVTIERASWAPLTVEKSQ